MSNINLIMVCKQMIWCVWSIKWPESDSTLNRMITRNGNKNPPNQWKHSYQPGGGGYFFWFIFRDIYSFGSFLFSLSPSKHDDKLMGNLLVIICAIARAYRRLHTTLEITISFTYLNVCLCVCVCMLAIIMCEWRRFQWWLIAMSFYHLPFSLTMPPPTFSHTAQSM